MLHKNGTYRLEQFWAKGVFFLCTLLILAWVFAPIWVSWQKTQDMREVEVTVSKTDVKRNGDASKYLIYGETKTGEYVTYEVTDNWFAGRHDSSDLYGQVLAGHTYRFEIGGKRMPLFSQYPNVYGAVEIKGFSK